VCCLVPVLYSSCKKLVVYVFSLVLPHSLLTARKVVHQLSREQTVAACCRPREPAQEMAAAVVVVVGSSRRNQAVHPRRKLPHLEGEAEGVAPVRS
jgi:hypothetical protein